MRVSILLKDKKKIIYKNISKIALEKSIIILSTYNNENRYFIPIDNIWLMNDQAEHIV